LAIILRITVCLLLFTFFCTNAQDFKSQQLKYKRVRVAKSETDSILKNLFKSKNLSYPPNNIFIRIFKFEKQLELWSISDNDSAYQLVKTYKVCETSGVLGPKRRRGDLQIPEGFYYINHFNPVSNFYLSIKVNYPNESDKILGYNNDLGGDIFIHGDCVTIGCVPITDKYIKELYWIAVQSKNNGQDKIPVHIFPMRMSENNITQLRNSYSDQNNLHEFWKNLKKGYDFFAKNKTISEYIVLDTGRYDFINSEEK